MLDIFQIPADQVEIPFSILDTDLYKLTMQNAVLKHFPNAKVVVRFTNRTPSMLFSRKSFEWIQEHLNRLSSCRLTEEERTTLQSACPYFPEEYLDYLENLQLDPQNQVELRFIPKNEDGLMGELECEIKGFWKEVILYEVPIMSIMSEGYFKFVDTDWNDSGQLEKAKSKGSALLHPKASLDPLIFSEFGTRRRRSFKTQDTVIRGLVEAQKEWKASGGRGIGLAGTSNVYLALKYGLQPMGTIAHEWIMAIGATYGYKGANGRAMDMWEEVYPRGPSAAPLTMLTDTYTASAFFVDFLSDTPRAMRWTTLRQDSGDPFTFVKSAKEEWEKVEIKAGLGEEERKERVKRVIFSDGLDVNRALKLQGICNDMGIGASFGIGTFLTNDFQKASDSKQVSKPLNIVIKLNQIDGRPCVKLSDDKGKFTGDLEEVKRVQQELSLPRDHEDKQKG